MTREPMPIDETVSEPSIETTAPPVSTTLREPSPQFVEKVTTAIRSGVSPYVASEWAGVSRSVFKKWMKKHDALRTAVRQATAHLKVRLEADLAKRSPEKVL